MKKIISILCIVAIMMSTFSIMAFGADTSYKPYEESQYFSYGDYDIHYRVIPAKGETKGRIMMLHGFMCSTFAWRNMAAEMSKKGYECLYNVFIMDETHTILSCGASAVTKLREPHGNYIERIFNYKYPYEYISGFEELISRKAEIGEFYDKYFKNGDVDRNLLTEFNSNNTELLTVEQVKEKLLSLEYIRNELKKEER